MGGTKTANTKFTVLALYPHASALGYAVMDTPVSIKSSNYRYLTRNRPEAYFEYIAIIMRRFDPQIVLIESEKSRSKSRGLRMQNLFYDIESLIEDLGYSIHYCSRQTIVETFNCSNKVEIVDAIIKRFPTYEERRPPRRISTDGSETAAWSEFDAISMAITYFLNLD